MSSTHKIDATIPVGDPDQGAEIEARITFTYQPRVAERGPTYSSGGQPAEPEMAEWVSAERLINGKPSPFYSAFADLEKGSFDAACEAWLESDEGQAQAIEHALDKIDGDRASAEEHRDEMRREDRENDR